MGKNCQNLLNTGELAVQGYSEEITGKVQKYARMSATQFVPYSYGELTIESIKEACIRHFTRQFQLRKTWPVMFWQVTKGLLVSSCHRFQISFVIHFRLLKLSVTIHRKFVIATALSLFNHEQDIELLKAPHYYLRSNQKETDIQ